jgi:hypothetical protein
LRIAGVFELFGRLVCGPVWGRELSCGDDRSLLFVDLAEGDGPGGRFVVAAAGGLVKIEGLEGSGKGEEEQGRSDEDAGVEMGQAQVFQELVGRGHDSYFLHKQMKIRRVRGDILF